MTEQELFETVRRAWGDPSDETIRIELDDHRIVYGGPCAPMDADLDTAIHEAGVALCLRFLLDESKTFVTKNGDHYDAWVIRWKVRYVAESLIANNPEYYGVDLLDLVPADILDTEISDNNFYELSIIVDQIRFRQEDEAAELLGYAAGWGTEPTCVREFARTVNSTPLVEPSSKLEEYARKIRYLLNVGASLSRH